MGQNGTSKEQSLEYWRKNLAELTGPEIHSSPLWMHFVATANLSGSSAQHIENMNIRTSSHIRHSNIYTLTYALTCSLE